MKLKPKVTLIKTSFTPRPYRPQPLPYAVQILYPVSVEIRHWNADFMTHSM